MRIGGDAQLPARQFGRFGGKFLQSFLIAVKRMGGGIHRPHPTWQPIGTKFNRPPFQIGKSVKHAVNDKRRQSLHGVIGDGHIADGCEICVTALKIRHGRQAVFLIDRIHRCFTANMEQYRQTGLLCHCPYRKQTFMARPMLLWATRRHHQRLGSVFNGCLRQGRAAVKIFQRHISDIEQSFIDTAKIAHHAIMGVRRAIAQIHIIALVETEIAEAESGENKLAADAKQIQCARSVGWQCRAHRLMIFA